MFCRDVQSIPPICDKSSMAASGLDSSEHVPTSSKAGLPQVMRPIQALLGLKRESLQRQYMLRNLYWYSERGSVLVDGDDNDEPKRTARPRDWAMTASRTTD